MVMQVIDYMAKIEYLIVHKANQYIASWEE